MSIAKRLIDILLSLIGIIMFMPLMVIIGLFIKLDSRGPVFYLADRVGKDMKNFKMYKFRTMIDTTVCVGQSVCPQYDPRVTSFGRFLRRTKMNELPQFINVLKGEMTFVGPRPEAPDLAELYPEEAKRIFSVKPGLVGPATILMRNEEELYPPGVDAKKYYIEKILPKKVEIDLEYLKSLNILIEFSFIFMAVKKTLLGALKKKHICDNRSQVYLLISDIFLIFCSYFLAIFIFTKNLSGGLSLDRLLTILFIFTVILLSFNIYFGVYTCVIRYISYHDILNVIKGVTSGSLIFVMLAWMLGLNYYPKTIVFIIGTILILALSILRIALKLYWDKSNSNINIKEKCNIFIYGANEKGISAYQAISSDKSCSLNVVGFIDDEPKKYGKKLHGIKVLGNRHHIKDLASLYKVDEIILSKPKIDSGSIIEVIKTCQKSGLRYRIFTSLSNIDKVRQNSLPIRNLKFTDLISNERVCVDYSALKNIITDKTVLINGTAGALGIELCSQILRLGCKKLIIIDQYECYLAEFLSSIAKPSTYDIIIPVVSDIRKTDILSEVFENHQPDIVIHAGTRKYNPSFNLNIDNIGEDNYLSTFKLAKITSKFNSEYFLMISSLEAAQNGDLISASLRVAEICLKDFFNDTNTRLIIARICNIIENRGGIVSNIEDQIRNQQMVTLPSPDNKTCLISKYSAAAFVLQTLVESNDMSNDKNIFHCDQIIKMNLVEVARKIALIYGLQLEDDIPILYTSPSKDHFSPWVKDQLEFDSLNYANKIDVKLNSSIYEKNNNSVFKDFMISNSKRLVHKNWKEKTRELIEMSGKETIIYES